MATSADSGRVPGWYWAVAILALLWEAMGCFSYISKVGIDAAALGQLPAVEREIWLAMPAWVTGAFAIAVWSGLLRAVGLLLRRVWARFAFALSLLAVIVQFGWTFLATPILTTIGTEAAALPAFILLMAALLLWFSSLAAKRGWLR